MKFAVVGVGPVGGIAVGCLLRAGHEVTLVDVATDRLEKIKAEGLHIRDPRSQLGGDFTVRPTKTATSLNALEEPVEVVLLAVKTYILPRLLDDLKQLDPATLIVSYQNGLDCEEVLAEALGPARVLRAVINYAGGLAAPNEVEVTFFNPPNYLGALDKGAAVKARELAATLTHAGLATDYTDDIKLHEWQKTLLNSALAPVCALTGLTMKGAMEYPPLRALIEQLLREGMAQGEQQGLVFSPDFVDQGMTYMDKGGFHKPSMLVDVEQGLPTEIDAMNGRIHEYGEAAGATPYHQAITALIKGIEARNRGERE